MVNYDDDNNEELVWISDIAEQQQLLLQSQHEHEVFPPEIVPSPIAAAHASANAACVSRPFMTSSNHSRSSSSSSSSSSTTCFSSSPSSSPLHTNSTITPPPPLPTTPLYYDSLFQSSLSSAFVPPHHPSLHKRKGRMTTTTCTRRITQLHQTCLSSILMVVDMCRLGISILYCFATKAILLQNPPPQNATVESPPWSGRVTCLLLQTKAWMLLQLQDYDSLHYAPSYKKAKDPYNTTATEDDDVCHEHEIC
mmetsp:Transcript_14879/g.20741  ORF Transcript_14879/g.20741 Transcript_14879/m.20741 type:complete len:252 (+) Transcript_14879:38-793(+)